MNKTMQNDHRSLTLDDLDLGDHDIGEFERRLELSTASPSESCWGLCGADGCITDNG